MSALSSVPPTPRRSSVWRAGWSRWRPRSHHSASTSLEAEVAPFGIHTTIVNPGFFRTELLTQESTRYAEPSLQDYAERTAAQQEWWKAQNGQQGGDPAKLAQALVTIASEEQPPRRFIAGADAIATAEQKVKDLQKQIDAYRGLSTSLALDEA